MAIYNTYFSVLGLQDSLGVLPNLGVLPGLGRLDDLGEYAFSPTSLFLNGEQGVWYDPSDLTPEKVSWRRNLLTYSQDFENAAWTKSNASILSNLMLYSQEFGTSPWVLGGTATVTSNTTTAPDGTTTADTLSFPASSNTIYQQSAATLAGVTYTMSVWLRADSPGTIRIAFANDGTKGVDVSVTTSWTRFTYTNTTAAGNDGMQIRRDSAGQMSAVYAWGAQLVPGSTAQTYTRSLATAAPIQFADPLGGTLADKLVVNTATSTHQISQTLTIRSGVSYAFSAYVKAAEYGWAIVYAGTIGVGKYINLSTGAVGSDFIAAPTSTTVVDAGNGWWRVEMIAQSGANTSADIRVYAATANGTSSYTGDGVSGIYVYGAQVEQASTASAYQRITDFSSDFLAAFPTHALYQESTGVTPVTALGQSVGLVLDKRLGGASNLGPELVTNGNFSQGTTGWSLGTGWSVSGGKAECIIGSGYTDIRSTDNIVQAGRTYKVTFDLVVSSGGVRLFLGGITTSTTVSNTATYTYYITPSASSYVAIIAYGSGGAFVGYVDNISVREVPGNHAIQATSASRPTLQARSNLLTYTEQFDNAAWNKSRSTITANATVAPDGTTTADKLIATSVAGTHRIFSTGIANSRTTIYTLSAYFKASEYTYAGLMVSDSTEADQNRVQWNLTDGTSINAPVGSTILLLSTSFTDVGNGWKRCAMTVSADATEPSINAWLFIIDNSNAASFTGNDVNGVFAWGAQFELGSTATTYQRVVTATDYADVGLPRNLTFDGVDDSLATAGNVDFATWTVGTRRNLLTVPTMFDDAAWSKILGLTVAANTVTAPDGTLTGDTLTFNTTNANRIEQTAGTAVNGETLTGSVWLKGSGTIRLLVDTSTGVGGAAEVPITLTSSWVRYTGTVTYSSPTGNRRLAIIWRTGDTAVNVDAWGAQLEVGSTATAFQDVGTDKVTLFSGVTKLSDAATGAVAELSTALGSNNGTFLFYAPRAAATPGYQWFSKGTTAVAATVDAGYAAPVTNVVTGIGDIGADVTTIRINASATLNNSDQGTGTYGSYLLYVGRRGGSTLPFNGRLFQLVIRGAATDSVTVGNAERWVGQLTGVNL